MRGRAVADRPYTDPRLKNFPFTVHSSHLASIINQKTSYNECIMQLNRLNKMEKLQRSQIDDELYLVLRTIYHYERKVEAQFGLDFQQIYVLQTLRRNAKARLTEIAEEMELPMFAASRVVSRLKEEGYLERVQDAADRRSQHLFLLEKGEAVLQAIEAASFERIMANIHEFPEPQVSELVNLAEKLHVVLGVTDKVIRAAEQQD